MPESIIYCEPSLHTRSPPTRFINHNKKQRSSSLNMIESNAKKIFIPKNSEYLRRQQLSSRIMLEEYEAARNEAAILIEKEELDQDVFDDEDFLTNGLDIATDKTTHPHLTNPIRPYPSPSMSESGISCEPCNRLPSTQFVKHRKKERSRSLNMVTYVRKIFTPKNSDYSQREKLSVSTKFEENQAAIDEVTRAIERLASVQVMFEDEEDEDFLLDGLDVATGSTFLVE